MKRWCNRGKSACHQSRRTNLQPGKLTAKYRPSELRRLRSEEDGLEQRVAVELASNVLVVEPSERSNNP